MDTDLPLDSKNLFKPNESDLATQSWPNTSHESCKQSRSSSHLLIYIVIGQESCRGHPTRKCGSEGLVAKILDVRSQGQQDAGFSIQVEELHLGSS